MRYASLFVFAMVGGMLTSSTAIAADAMPASMPKNAVIAEGFGAGLWYSLNYERRLDPDIAVRIGLSAMPVHAYVTTTATRTYPAALFMLPVHASYLGIRKGKHGLELGTGFALSITTGTATSNTSSTASGVGTTGLGIVGNVLVGYRYQPIDTCGLQLRAGAMALFGKGLNVFGNEQARMNVAPFGYLSVGYVF